MTIHRRNHCLCGEVPVLAVTLIDPTPMLVLRHRNARRKRPVKPCAGDLLRGNSSCLANERQIAGGGHTNVVRKHRRAFERVLTMNRVNGDQQGNTQSGLQRGRLEAIKSRLPIYRRCTRDRPLGMDH